MRINIGDLFVLLDTELYYVKDIEYDEDKKPIKFILYLLNPQKKVILTKRIMYPENIFAIFNDKSSRERWKYYPVKQ